MVSLPSPTVAAFFATNLSGSIGWAGPPFALGCQARGAVTGVLGERRGLTRVVGMDGDLVPDSEGPGDAAGALVEHEDLVVPVLVRAADDARGVLPEGLLHLGVRDAPRPPGQRRVLVEGGRRRRVPHAGDRRSKRVRAGDGRRRTRRRRRGARQRLAERRLRPVLGLVTGRTLDRRMARDALEGADLTRSGRLRQAQARSGASRLSWTRRRHRPIPGRALEVQEVGELGRVEAARDCSGVRQPRRHVPLAATRFESRRTGGDRRLLAHRLGASHGAGSSGSSVRAGFRQPTCPKVQHADARSGNRSMVRRLRLALRVLARPDVHLDEGPSREDQRPIALGGRGGAGRSLDRPARGSFVCRGWRRRVRRARSRAPRAGRRRPACRPPSRRRRHRRGSPACGNP